MAIYDPDLAYFIIQPLILFIFGLAIYSVVIYNLYKFVAKRDIFNLNLRQYNKFNHPFFYKVFAIILYIIEYILFFPLFLMIWFIVFSAILIALSKTQSIETILLISMAVISSIRMVSYYSQTLSKDLAKLIPFALMVVILLEDVTSFFSFDKSLELIRQIPSMLDVLAYYFIFVLVLELILRVVYSVAIGLSLRNKNI